MIASSMAMMSMSSATEDVLFVRPKSFSVLSNISFSSTGLSLVLIMMPTLWKWVQERIPMAAVFLILVCIAQLNLAHSASIASVRMSSAFSKLEPAHSL